MWSNKGSHALLVGVGIRTITSESGLHFVIKLELHIPHHTAGPLPGVSQEKCKCLCIMRHV